MDTNGVEFKNQLQMFNYIWDTRDHVSEISGKPLLNRNNFKWHFQFAHVLSKGQYTKYKLNPNNIMLMLPEEHEKQETFPKFIEKRDELKRKYYKEFYNKKFV